MAVTAAIISYYDQHPEAQEQLADEQRQELMQRVALLNAHRDQRVRLQQQPQNRQQRE